MQRLILLLSFVSVHVFGSKNWQQHYGLPSDMVSNQVFVMLVKLLIFCYLSGFLSIIFFS